MIERPMEGEPDMDRVLPGGWRWRTVRLGRRCMALQCEYPDLGWVTVRWHWC